MFLLKLYDVFFWLVRGNYDDCQSVIAHATVHMNSKQISSIAKYLAALSDNRALQEQHNAN